MRSGNRQPSSPTSRRLAHATESLTEVKDYMAGWLGFWEVPSFQKTRETTANEKWQHFSDALRPGDIVRTPGPNLTGLALYHELIYVGEYNGEKCFLEKVQSPGRPLESTEGIIQPITLRQLKEDICKSDPHYIKDVLKPYKEGEKAPIDQASIDRTLREWGLLQQNGKLRTVRSTENHRANYDVMRNNCQVFTREFMRLVDPAVSYSQREQKLSNPEAVFDACRNIHQHWSYTTGVLGEAFSQNWANIRVMWTEGGKRNWSTVRATLAAGTEQNAHYMRKTFWGYDSERPNLLPNVGSLLTNSDLWTLRQRAGSEYWHPSWVPVAETPTVPAVHHQIAPTTQQRAWCDRVVPPPLPSPHAAEQQHPRMMVTPGGGRY